MELQGSAEHGLRTTDLSSISELGVYVIACTNVLLLLMKKCLFWQSYEQSSLHH
jgi:hypothetical protein